MLAEANGRPGLITLSGRKEPRMNPGLMALGKPAGRG